MSGYGVFSTAAAAADRVAGRRQGRRPLALGDVYAQPSLNALMALGRASWAEALAAARAHDGPRMTLAAATMHLPFEVADYVDF